MSKTKLIVLACFVAAFAAGLVAGMAGKRVTEPERPPPDRSWIEGRLDLTPEQREQMHQIWSSLLRREQQRERQEAFQKERDAAIQELLTDEQKMQYEAVVAEYTQKVEALSQERRKAFEDAVARTKAMLSEEQRVKYEQMLKQREGGRSRRGRPGRETGESDSPARPPADE